MAKRKEVTIATAIKKVKAADSVEVATHINEKTRRFGDAWVFRVSKKEALRVLNEMKRDYEKKVYLTSMETGEGETVVLGHGFSW
jgi:hypothetical protein